ncbi:hypothetical protein DFP72DRAFT_846800 [Ephemerocybe angulata]|uniref:Uncharacterized protein n=1 Tax=Ephemerocybe angulata TaxID=980116 RepID=A0A8H6I0J8_9AGAR|nr:hypothetical protein DFP72DRAFT_846800 [Tulosesus angulatus]
MPAYFDGMGYDERALDDRVKKAGSFLIHDQRVLSPFISPCSGGCGGTVSVSSLESTPPASPSQSSPPLSPSPQTPSRSMELGRVGDRICTCNRSGRLDPKTLETEERRILDTVWSYGIARRTLMNDPTTHSKTNFRQAQECVRGILRDCPTWDPPARVAADHALTLLLAIGAMP